MTSLPDTPEPLFEGDPSEDAAERLADAMGDPTHPMHEEAYEAEEEAFTRRFEREQLASALSKPAAFEDFDGPARPDPVGPGQTLLRQLDAQRRPAPALGMFPEGRIRYPGGRYDPRYD